MCFQEEERREASIASVLAFGLGAFSDNSLRFFNGRDGGVGGLESLSRARTGVLERRRFRGVLEIESYCFSSSSCWSSGTAVLERRDRVLGAAEAGKRDVDAFEVAETVELRAVLAWGP